MPDWTPALAAYDQQLSVLRAVHELGVVFERPEKLGQVICWGHNSHLGCPFTADQCTRLHQEIGPPENLHRSVLTYSAILLTRP